jgi:hypothetical protein
VIDVAIGVDTEDGLHELVGVGPAGKRLNPMSHKAATHQMHDRGLVITLCRQASVNSDAAFVCQDKTCVEIFPIVPFPPPKIEIAIPSGITFSNFLFASRSMASTGGHFP